MSILDIIVNEDLDWALLYPPVPAPSSKMSDLRLNQSSVATYISIIYQLDK